MLRIAKPGRASQDPAGFFVRLQGTSPEEDRFPGSERAGGSLLGHEELHLREVVEVPGDARPRERVDPVRNAALPDQGLELDLPFLPQQAGFRAIS